MDVRDARRRLTYLQNDLQNIVKKDQEQEVRGIALPVIDAVLSGIRPLIRQDDPVLHALSDLISPETVAQGEPIRAVDALLVVSQMLAALPSPGPTIA